MLNKLKEYFFGNTQKSNQKPKDYAIKTVYLTAEEPNITNAKSIRTVPINRNAVAVNKSADVNDIDSYAGIGFLLGSIIIGDMITNHYDSDIHNDDVFGKALDFGLIGLLDNDELNDGVFDGMLASDVYHTAAGESPFDYGDNNDYDYDDGFDDSGFDI